MIIIILNYDKLGYLIINGVGPTPTQLQRFNILYVMLFRSTLKN